MPKHSAGILMYRRRGDQIQVFLVHPGGPYWSRRDLRAWSIPKGEFENGEDALAAAKREFEEETGMKIGGALAPLTLRKQPSGKVVHVWIRSNMFEMEWPPRSGRMQRFPEVDRAAWFAIDIARQKLHKGQVGFLDELERRLAPASQENRGDQVPGN